MKLNGKTPVHNIKTLVLPREGSEPVVFKCAAVTDLSPYEKLCPDPTPPLKTLKGGAKVPDYEDKGYVMAVAQQGDRRWNFIVLTSLQATEGIEWETVKLDNPETWGGWRKEMADSGLSVFEINRVIQAVSEANCLSEETVEAARQSFLAAQGQA
jgi:hypothetical protein